MLDSIVWGRGLATEGGAALRAAFGPLRLRRVTAQVRLENAASLAVMRELGIRFGGEVQVLGAQGGRYAAHALMLLAGGGPGGVGACTTC